MAVKQCGHTCQTVSAPAILYSWEKNLWILSPKMSSNSQKMIALFSTYAEWSMCKSDHYDMNLEATLTPHTWVWGNQGVVYGSWGWRGYCLNLGELILSTPHSLKGLGSQLSLPIIFWLFHRHMYVLTPPCFLTFGGWEREKPLVTQSQTWVNYVALGLRQEDVCSCRFFFPFPPYDWKVKIRWSLYQRCCRCRL